MAKRILVPIDAREHSETIVPVVAALAHGTGATVRFLRVFPVPDRVVDQRGKTIAYSDQEMARLTAQGLDELRRIEAQMDGIPMENVVRFGEPTEEILLEAEPGVAEQVARKAPVPTLVLREPRAIGNS